MQGTLFHHFRFQNKFTQPAEDPALVGLILSQPTREGIPMAGVGGWQTFAFCSEMSHNGSDLPDYEDVASHVC